MGHYRVLTRLRRNGREHAAGEVIPLPPQEALPLVMAGVVAEAVTIPAVVNPRGRRRVQP